MNANKMMRDRSINNNIIILQNKKNGKTTNYKRKQRCGNGTACLPAKQVGKGKTKPKKTFV